MLIASPSLLNIGMTGPSDKQISELTGNTCHAQLTSDKNVGGFGKFLHVGRLHLAGVVGGVHRLDLVDGEVGRAQRVQGALVLLTIQHCHAAGAVDINPAQCF